MKLKLVLFLTASLFIGTLIAQTTGGPDTYGYTWKNQADPTGPVYNWIDIKGLGTKITGLGDDNSVGPFNMNWNFRYYWNDYNKALVGSNGWMSFEALGNIASPFPTIPSAAAPNNYIAALLSDLTFTNGSNAPVPNCSGWYWTNNLDTFIVQYDSVPFWSATGQKYTGSNTFQIILSGVDSSITFQYKAQTGLTNGTDIKSGIENLTGAIGLQVLNNTYPTANTAVKFYYPNPVTYQVFDATPAWNQNTKNGGFFVSSNGKPLNLTTDIANTGNQPISNIPVTGTLLDVNAATVWTSTRTVTALPAGADTVFTYPTNYNANTPGTFRYRSATTLTGDMNPGNNSREVEMVVVDTTQSSIELSYTTATSASAGLGWSGGGVNDGAGVYFEPPFYPASVVSLDYFIASGATGGFTAEVRDDNGTNNGPGTVLSSDTIMTGNIGAFNNVPMTKPIVITSGGIYVSWLMHPDTTCNLGADAASPLSLRNYEIIGGNWATYRNNSAQDLMIKTTISKYDFGAITTSVVNDACPSNASGTASVSVTPGTSPPYTYLWSPGNQTTTSITGLAAGTYTCAITDSIGITNNTIVNVYNAISVTAASTASVTCFGSNNGASMATIGGTAPYTYLWSNGQTTQTATGLVVGIYTVTATNTDGCVNMAVDTIVGPTAIASTLSVTAASCAGSDGTAALTISGGTAPYTFLWNNLQTTATATGLAAGSYTVAVSDANGCTFTSTVTITFVPFASSTASTPTKCFGSSDGVATSVVSTGGTTPYTYAWTPTGQTTQVATGLAAGNYTVLTTDAKGCTTTKTITVTSPVAIVASSTAQPASCTTCTNGSATGSVTGGTAPYVYAWSNGVTAQTITGLGPGNYTVCVTDANGCSGCDTVNVLINGISEHYTGASVVISPNPFTSSAFVNIDFVNPTHNNLLFTIFDIYGKVIEVIDLSSYKGAKIEFNLNRGNNISNGLYFYRLEDNNTILSTGKLLVQ